MRFRDTLASGLEALLGHGLRSLLTVLGILIGIAAVILTVGLGEGAQASVSSAISALGSNLLVVTPGSTTSAAGVRGGFGSASTLTLGDADALENRRAAPNVLAVAPTAQSIGTITAGSNNWTTSVVGTTAVVARRPRPSACRGKLLHPVRAEERRRRRRARDHDIGGAVRAGSPVGQTIDDAGVSLTVIGVLTSAGSSASTNEDDMVLVPITTAEQQIFGGTTAAASVSTIYVEADSQAALSGRIPGDERPAARASPHHRTVRRRLHHHHPVPAAVHRELGEPNAHRPPRRHRRDLAARRRHRRHEHHAGVGDRTGARDRPAQGRSVRRRTRSGASSSWRHLRSASSAASGVSCSRWWGWWSLPHLESRPRDDLAGGGHRGGRRGHRHRPRVRCVPRQPRRPALPDRRPPHRMTGRRL